MIQPSPVPPRFPDLSADANCEAVLPDYTSLVTLTDNCGNEISSAGPIVQGANENLFYDGNVNSITQSGYTVPAGNDRIIMVSAGVRNNTASSITSVTFNGQSLTLAASETTIAQYDFPYEISLWYLALGSGAAQSGDVVVSASQSSYNMIATVFNLENVSQSIPVGDVNTNSSEISNITSSSIAVNTDPGDWVVDMNYYGGHPGSSASTTLFSFGAFGRFQGGYINAVSSSTTSSYNWTNFSPGGWFMHLAVEVNQAAGNLSLIQSPVAGSTIGLGTTSITMTVEDAAGNQADCTVNVDVVDGHRSHHYLSD